MDTSNDGYMSVKDIVKHSRRVARAMAALDKLANETKVHERVGSNNDEEYYQDLGYKEAYD